MAQAMEFDTLTVELRAQNVQQKDGKFPRGNAYFSLIRPLGIFRVLDLKGAPLSQPSAVRLVVDYTTNDVNKADGRGQRLLLGIWFSEPTLLWASADPVNPLERLIPSYWLGSGWFAFEIPDPNPEGGQFSLDISGNLSDPAVGVGSG